MEASPTENYIQNCQINTKLHLHQHALPKYKSFCENISWKTYFHSTVRWQKHRSRRHYANDHLVFLFSLREIYFLWIIQQKGRKKMAFTPMFFFSSSFLFLSLQNLKNQIMTTNLVISIFFIYFWIIFHLIVFIIFSFFELLLDTFISLSLYFRVTMRFPFHWGHKFQFTAQPKEK